MSEWRLPLSDLDYGAEEEAAVLRVLRSKWLSMGAEVEAFEREFANFLGVRHAFAVANGTAALHLAYLALGLGPGDEIVQPAINFVAAANMTVAIGAAPVFADILGVESPVVDPARIEACISPRTRAVVVLHYGGYPAPMAQVKAICARRGLALVEDACHALGSTYDDPRGRRVGAAGDVACFSFFSNKNLATGEGGMVVTDRDDLAEPLRLLRSHGMTTSSWDRHRGHASSYDVLRHGYNYRLDEVHAALGRTQLEKLDANNRRRRDIVAAYCRGLEGVEGWAVTFAGRAEISACHLMVVVAPDAERRATAVAMLKQAGVQTSLHYPCVADFEAFRGFVSSELPRSRDFSVRALTLPLFPHMTSQDVEHTCMVLRRCASSSS